MSTDSFEVAVAEFRFGDAIDAISELPVGERSAAEARLALAKVDAVDRAEELAGRIQELARKDHYAALLAIADDPATSRLLDLVPDEIRRGARIHLEGAARRQSLSRKSTRRHLDGADQALDEYDPGEARKLLAKIDGRFLTDEMRSELALLRARLDKVSEETRELATASAKILARHEHPAGSTTRRGCLSTAASVVAVVLGGAALALLA